MRQKSLFQDDAQPPQSPEGRKGGPKVAKNSNRLSYRALQIVQNKQPFFFLTIPVDELAPFCSVSRRHEDPVDGFQRELSESRADDIARYLAEGGGSIPSNIVLSAQENANLKYNARNGSVSFTPGDRAFLVLDGQHRLWGYQKCKKKHRIPVSIYSGLTRQDEAKLFIDINTTQKGVPSALLLDIKQVANVESNKEQIVRGWFDKLQSDSRSPLAGKMSASKSLPNRISRVTFRRALEGALTEGVLLEIDPASRYRVILNYLNAFDAELPEESKGLLARAAYFEAIFDVFDHVIRRADETGDAKKETLQKIIRPLTRFDFTCGTGRSLASKKQLVNVMRKALHRTVKFSDDNL
jgi:DGQHR domain-containing protein